MALPLSGTISLSQVNVELNKPATAVITMGDPAVRALAGVPSGAISMSNLYGKAAESRYVNTVNLAQATIHAIMGSPTSPGTYIFENHATIHAATQSGWALQTGVFPAGSTLKIINRGHIRGGGGNGGSAGSAGSAGGSALVLNYPATIDNTAGTIWGGGGGGGGSAVFGGAGGGAGSPAGNGSLYFPGYGYGANGTLTKGGAGYVIWAGVYFGGNGGDVGAAGTAGRDDYGSRAGGRGGYSVETNGNVVTWIAAGDRRGSVV